MDSTSSFTYFHLIITGRFWMKPLKMDCQETLKRLFHWGTIRNAWSRADWRKIRIETLIIEMIQSKLYDRKILINKRLLTSTNTFKKLYKVKFIYQITKGNNFTKQWTNNFLMKMVDVFTEKVSVWTENERSLKKILFALFR